MISSISGLKLWLSLAWRNIWRHKTRTALTLGVIAFSSSILVFFIGLQLSSYEASISASTSIFHGHLQVQSPGYQDKPQIRNVLSKPTELQQDLDKLKYIHTTAIRSFGFALASSENRSYGAQVVGVQVNKEPQVSTIPLQIKTGQYFSSPSAYEAVLGQDLANNLKIAINDELTLLGQGKDGSLAASVVKVVGIFQSGSRDLDRAMIHLPLQIFDEVFSMQGTAHSIVIRADSIDQLAKLQRNANSLIKKQNLTSLRWDQILPGLKEAIELDMASGWLFYFSLVLVVTFIVLNTFLMSVLERTREFGVMLSLGTSPRGIAGLIFTESLLLTTIGLLAGILVGGAFIIYFGIHGFQVPGSEEIMKLWNLPAAVHTKLSLAALTQGPVVILITTMLGMSYPALRIFKLQPVEALRQ